MIADQSRVLTKMSRDSQTPGPFLAALGAGGALLSLWAPWYSFQIPQELLNRAAALAGQFGILGPAIQQYTLQARAMGPYHLTAWDVFHQIDVILAVVAAVAASFALLAFTGRGTGDREAGRARRRHRRPARRLPRRSTRPVRPACST